MTIDLNFFNKFFIDYQQRFVHFACTYVHDEAVAEDFVIESMMYYLGKLKTACLPIPIFRLMY